MRRLVTGLWLAALFLAGPLMFYRTGHVVGSQVIPVR
jgi:hypothetical protein